MNKVKDWIRHHQVAAFFIITFAITWGLGFAWGAVLQRNQYLLMPLVFISACGPGLAGIIISAVTNTQPRQGSRKAFWSAFLVAWIVSMLVYLANLKFIEQFLISPAVVGLSTISVVPVAFVIASAYSRIPSLRSYLASLIQLRGVWGWSLLALVLFPALLLISFLINNRLNRQPIISDQLPDLNLVLIGLVIIKFLYQLFFFNATGEETGWRGFALPRLQARTSPLIAALVIAFFWCPFHLIVWQAEGRPVVSVEFWIEMYLGHALLSVMIVWICNRAKGSILAAGIAHAATNTAQAFIPAYDLLILTLSITVLLMIFLDRMWERLPSKHPAVYHHPGMIKTDNILTNEIMEVLNV